MKYLALRGFYVGLLALCLFVVVFAVPALAQEEYQITATLQAPELEAGAASGSSVAVSGDIVVVGEPLADVEGKVDAGRAYIFDSSGNLLATLQSPTPQVAAEFGISQDDIPNHTPPGLTLRLLAVSGGIVVIGERGADVEGVSDAGRAYIIRAAGAAFALGSLIVDPSSVDEGGTVTISIDVTNTGSLSGSHTMTLKIDDEVVDEKTVTLNPDETETVSFEVPATQQGTFTVDINGLSGSYTVTPRAIPRFPYELIILGLAVGALILWMLLRRR